MDTTEIVCFLLAVFATFSFSFATSALLNDDPEEEAIPLQTNEPGEGDANLRGNSYIPILATYNPSLCRITVEFLNNIGDIDMRLTNLSAGGSSTIQTNAYCGNVYIPILYGSGYYCIEFLCDGVTMYSGYFNVL